MRHKDSDAYEQVGNPPEGMCYESAVTCASQPILAFNSVKWKQSERGHWGGNWEGVYSFNLSSKELNLRLSEKNLTLDEPHLRMWITELVSLSEDADSLYVNVAVRKRFPMAVLSTTFSRGLA